MIASNSLLDDAPWDSLRQQWAFPPGVAYLNHGSFGPPPRVVREERRKWLSLVERDPMDFFMRRQEDEFLQSVAQQVESYGIEFKKLMAGKSNAFKTPEGPIFFCAPA